MNIYKLCSDIFDFQTDSNANEINIRNKLNDVTGKTIKQN